MTRTTREHARSRRYTTVGPDAPDLERYASVSLEDGGGIIFDGEVTEAWLQSDATVDLAAVA